MTAPKPTTDDDELLAAIEHADVRVLLLSLVHLTGDERWIRDPYLPKRDVRLVAGIDAGFDAELAASVRAEVARRITGAPGGRPVAVITDPGPQLMGEMMSVCLGERVPDEYVPMVRAEMGFHRADAALPVHTAPPPGFSVLVIGAGVSGLGIAHRLRAMGVRVRVVEKNADVGGTWLENRYPGCAVDTPNHFYSFSHTPNPGWRHYFSPRDELYAYVRGFADGSGLRELIDFDTTVTAVRWDEAAQCWHVSVEGPHGARVVEASVVVSAIGHFNAPTVAAFEGADTFRGELFHSARWPDALDLAGRDVAVIGTGASSMQIVPTIAPVVGSLTVYQRTAQWARHVPELNDTVRPGAAWLFEHLPYYYEWHRFTLFWRYGDGLLRHLRKDPDWPHPDRSLNRINDRHRQEMADYIAAQLDGRPDLLAKCLPDYPPYGKRILLDKGWFAALREEHVELVTEPIARFDADGIVTADGTHRRADVAVVATGFSVTDLAARLGVTGRGGRTLAQDWEGDNPRAHLGITVPGFPNFFCMYGPNTNAGHGGSAILIGECQTRYITHAVAQLCARGGGTMDVLPAVRDEYVARVDAEHEQLVWTHPGMSTYYRNRHGRVVSPMPFRLVDYFHSTRCVDPDEFTWSAPHAS